MVGRAPEGTRLYGFPAGEESWRDRREWMPGVGHKVPRTTGELSGTGGGLKRGVLLIRMGFDIFASRKMRVYSRRTVRVRYTPVGIGLLLALYR